MGACHGFGSGSGRLRGLCSSRPADGGVQMGTARPGLPAAGGTPDWLLLGVAGLRHPWRTHAPLVVLKDLVTSPGGTTIAGLHALESAGFRGVVMDAVTAAVVRG